MKTYGDAQSKLYTYNGQEHTIVEWARILKIHEATIRSRLATGCNFEEAISQCRIPRKNVDLYKWNGEEHTLYQWSQILGIQYHTLLNRAKKGFCEEKLFKSPNHMGHYRKFGNFKY